MVLGQIILYNGRRHFGPTANPIRMGFAGQLEHARRPVGVNVFFFLSAGRVTLLHETGFLHIKGIKIFGYEIVIEK